MYPVNNVKKIVLLMVLCLGFVFADGINISSIRNTDIGTLLKSEKVYYGNPKKNRGFLEELDIYIQPQVGWGCNITQGQHSIIMLGAYSALEYKFLRLGFSGNIGSSIKYYGVQAEAIIPLISMHSLVLRAGNWGRKSSNVGIFYEARVENISALIGVEFCTDDIVLFDDYSYMFTIGMGIILDDMNY